MADPSTTTEAKVRESIKLQEDGGVVKETLVEGTGEETPPNGVEVKVHYVGTLVDGTEFDSSRKKNEPFTFVLGSGQVIKGWDIGVATMKKGEKCILTCTSEYAYGENGREPTIPPNATLKFEVELLDWYEEKITTDRLITKVKQLKDGEGYMTPNDGATCHVRYTGSVASSGAVFSEEQERKLIVGEDELVPSGFNTVLKHMKKGQRSIFRIKPSEHHFEEHEMPSGLTADDEILYDVELVEFEKQPEIWSMSVEEKLEYGALCKTRGNTAFKKKRWQNAAKKYELGVSSLENLNDASDEQKAIAREVQIACWNNLSIIHLRDKKFQTVLTNSTKVLKEDADNLKALYRRSVAEYNTGRFDEALEDIKRALQLDKDNQAFITHYHTVKKRLAAERKKQKQIYQKMFVSSKKAKSSPSSDSADASMNEADENEAPNGDLAPSPSADQGEEAGAVAEKAAEPASMETSE